ncbi:MAG: nucleotidyltransferase domain-containing protein [Oscillospiraceae bacterium]|nr:nucleotidyltransferase domain-containing protein [Oscillospiraceae bacterium]
MSDRIYSIEEIKSIVAPIATKYDVDGVFLFGSYARGEATNTSDLDFVIDKGRLRGLKFAGMLGDLQENFDKNVDLITSSSLMESNGYIKFRQKIEKDMIIIYEQ